VEHLQKLRDLQDETGGFTAFICWTYQKDPELPMTAREVGSFEYLRMLAVSRLFLDNIENHQSSWVTQGPKVGQLGLWNGANDMGSTMMEENVVSAAGCTFNMDAREIELIIRRAGFQPRQRNFYYEHLPEEKLVTRPGDEIPKAPTAAA
jgi:cyclic dehypoxanthinyl futalosine synthase